MPETRPKNLESYMSQVREARECPRGQRTSLQKKLVRCYESGPSLEQLFKDQKTRGIGRKSKRKSGAR